MNRRIFLLAISLILFFTVNINAQYSFECIECDVAEKSDCKDCGGRVSQSSFTGIRVQKNGRTVKELHFPFEVHRTGSRVCIEELADNRETFCLGKEQTFYRTGREFFDSLLMCQKNIIVGDTIGNGGVETITTITNTINGNPIGIYNAEDGQTYSIDETITSISFSQEALGSWTFIYNAEGGSTTIQNLCTIVSDCLPEDVDTTINGLTLEVNNTGLVATITDDAGQTFTDNIVLDWDGDAIDTTGLKVWVENLITSSTSDQVLHPSPIEIDGISTGNTNASLVELAKRDNVKSVSDYSALRAFDGVNYEHELIIVDDFTYTFNSETYTTLGGVFRKVPSGTENGGTIIVASDGIVYERIWDNKHVFADWWEVGGYSWNGKPFVDKDVISTDAITISDRVFHDGIFNDCDRIRSAASVAESGDIVTVAKITDVVIDITIDGDLDGEDESIEYDFANILLSRVTSDEVTTTGTISISDLSFDVTNANQYRVGQQLHIVDVTLPGGGRNYNEGVIKRITSISGNTITVNTSFTRVFPIGSRVFINGTILRTSSNGTNQQSQVRNFSINGNRLNGGNTRYPSDWRYNHAIVIGTSENPPLIENGYIYDSPSESIFIPSYGRVYEVDADSLDGSFVHGSGSDQGQRGLSTSQMYIANCTVNGVCLAGDAVTDHSEAAITNSARFKNLQLINCNFSNGKEGIIAGDVNSPANEGFIQITGGVYKNFKNIIETFDVGSASQPEREDGFYIRDASFYNCGRVLLWGENATTGKSINDIKIEKNTFYDTRFSFRECTNVSVSNNSILFDTAFHTDFLNRPLPNSALETYSVFDIQRSSNVSISNNKIESFETLDTLIAVAFNINAEECRRKKNSAGVDENVYWEQDIHIDDNTIKGFLTGVTGIRGFKKNLNAVNTLYTTVNWTFNGNEFTQHPDAFTYPVAQFQVFKTAGFFVPAGATANNNIIKGTKEDSDFVGMVLYGQLASGGSAAEYFGATARFNSIDGFGTGDDVQLAAFNNGYNFNITFTDNEYSRPINYIANPNIAELRNTQKSAFPAMTNKQVTPIRFFEQDKNVY